MDILENVLIVFHFIGLASILGGVLVQIKLFSRGEARVLPVIMSGVWLQLITGVALVGVLSVMPDEEPNNIKYGVKLFVLIVIAVIAIPNREKERPASWAVPAIGLLTLANIVISVFWH